MDYAFNIDILMEQSEISFFDYSMQALDIYNEQLLSEAEGNKTRIIDRAKELIHRFVEFLKSIPKRLKELFTKFMSKSKAQDKIIEKGQQEAKKSIDMLKIAESPKVNPNKETADEEMVRKARDIVFKRIYLTTKKTEEVIKSKDKESSTVDKETKSPDISGLPALKEVDVYFLNQKDISKSIEVEEENLGAFDDAEKLIDNFLKTGGSDVESLVGHGNEKKYTVSLDPDSDPKKHPFYSDYSVRYSFLNGGPDWFYMMKVNNIGTIYNKLSNDYEYLLSVEDKVNNIIKINDKTINRIIPKCYKLERVFTDISRNYKDTYFDLRTTDKETAKKYHKKYDLYDRLISALGILRNVLKYAVTWITDQFRNLIQYKSVLARYFYSMVVKRAA